MNKHIPSAALEILRQARWEPDATRSYEVLSGGFVWSDESLQEIASMCTQENNWSFRSIIAYRASLIRGLPRLELRDPWDQLLLECPAWPGFRTRRSSAQLLEELNQANRKALENLNGLFDDDPEA